MYTSYYVTVSQGIMKVVTITQNILKPDMMDHLIFKFHCNLISNGENSLYSSLEVTVPLYY